MTSSTQPRLLPADFSMRGRSAESGRSAATPPVRPPGLLRTTLARSRVELLAVFRSRQSLVFTMLFPVLMLVILGSIFSGNVQGTDVEFRQVFIAGVLAAGVMSVAFSGLAMNIAVERDRGLIRRLGVSPMPRAAYFLGKLVRVAVTTLLETLVLLAIAVLAFHLPLPADAQHYLTLAWVLPLGTTACALLAVAYSSLIPHAGAAAAIVTPPFIALQFISGVFFPFGQLPSWMQTVGAFFPLKWLAQGFRYVFLPVGFQRVEPAGNWELGHIALVLGIWAVAMLVVSLLTFRWKSTRVH